MRVAETMVLEDTVELAGLVALVELVELAARGGEGRHFSVCFVGAEDVVVSVRDVDVAQRKASKTEHEGSRQTQQRPRTGDAPCTRGCVQHRRTGCKRTRQCRTARW